MKKKTKAASVSPLTSVSVSRSTLDFVREVSADMKRNRKCTIEIMLEFAYRMHKNGVKIFDF